eukprot:GCRY01005466.1.p1 GENE.GCRY01005466.1~~GCRY01005466.1.p1  ORF type:complete len:303 (+),score=48.05 GCRY01005466.1:214-1122(+)
MSSEISFRHVRTLEGHKGSISTVKFNSDGNYCMSCGQDSILKLWNPHQGTEITQYKGHGSEVLDVTFGSENNVFASCGADKQVFVWDVASGHLIRKFIGHNSRVNSVSFNKECSVIASGSFDTSVRLWDVKSRMREPIQILENAKDSVSSVEINDYLLLTGCVDGCVRQYDVRNGQLITDTFAKPVTYSSYSSDRNCVLVNTLDSNLRLLDCDSGELLANYKGHENKKYRVGSCFTVSDEFVVSGSEDCAVYCWELVESKLVARLEGHKGPVTDVAAHPRQNILLSSSVDGTVRVWWDTRLL